MGYLATVYEVKQKGKWVHFGHERAVNGVGETGKTLEKLNRKYRVHHEWVIDDNGTPNTNVSEIE